MISLSYPSLFSLTSSIFYCFFKLYYLLKFLFFNREEAAINQLITLSKDTRAGGSAEGAHLHIVHLSDARTSLNLIKVTKHFSQTSVFFYLFCILSHLLPLYPLYPLWWAIFVKSREVIIVKKFCYSLSL